MDFVAYLISKNIDNQKFESSDQALFSLWQQEFMLMNPKSFTAQKLFAINNVRRKYQLHMGAKPKEKAVVVEKTSTPTIAVPNDSSTKPKVVPSFKKPAIQNPEAIENKEVATNTVSTINIETNNEQTSESTKKPAFKPVFKRPVPTEKTNTPETTSTVDATETGADTSPKKSVAKPVFKRPENTESSPINAPEEKPDEVTNTEQPIKKVAAKPIFKRPEAKAQEVTQAEAVASTQNIAAPQESTPTEEKPNTETPAKKAMPRPVFKRPE